MDDARRGLGPVDPDQLLVLVEARPDIYNFTSKDHHNAEKINKLWEEIGKEMNAQGTSSLFKYVVIQDVAYPPPPSHTVTFKQLSTVKLL